MLRSPTGSAAVLEGIDLEIAAGEVFGLIGESGSGKTTLANTVLNILPAEAHVAAGKITLGDGDPNQKSGERRVAYVPQDPSTALDPLFTVGAQIHDILKANRPDLATRSARHVHAVAHLRAVQFDNPDSVMRRLPHEISGGQRQRLIIALALMINPILIVADEPTTALDLTIQAQILKLLRTLVDESGAAALITTHDPGVAHEICDTVAVMYAGGIVEQAATSVLLSRPMHPYTRRLLAARGQNFRAAAAISGVPPTPFERPSGCAFHPRCPERQPRCGTEPPPAITHDGHMARCWLIAS